MNVIIFSKNRAMQLSLLLRSIKKHTDITGVTILWTASNKEFADGYCKLLLDSIESKDNVIGNCIKETDFKNDLLSIDFKDELTCFFVDDDVIINDFKQTDKEFQQFKNDDSIACFSLRLGKNLTYCYTRNEKQILPDIENGKWRWPGASCDWGYLGGIDGDIWRTEDILPLLKNLNYTGPNSLEGQLVKNSVNRPFMSCYPTSRLFGLPINKVNTEANNRCGNISSEYLNEMFLKGFSIDLEDVENTIPSACHEERTIVFQEAKQCR